MSTQISDHKHSIQVVAGRTGLSPDVIRAWERRYGAVRPERSPTRRRLYSDDDVERLILLRRATLAGRRIGDVAALSVDELSALVREDTEAIARVPSSPDAPVAGRSARSYLDDCMGAALRLDANRLESALQRACVELEITSLLDGVISPMMEQIGERWLRGTLSIAHEHMATALVRSQLDTLRATFSNPDAQSTLIAATPAGEMHELGALRVAILAAVEGWRAVYLGPNLPADEIADAATKLGARAVALSLVFADREPELEDELERLSKLLPKGTALVVGGKGAGAHLPLLSRIGTLMPDNLVELRSELARLR